MAAGFRFVCSGCDHSVESWDDGNPYYVNEDGKKQYAYHPDPLRYRCIGNDSPNLWSVVWT